MKILCGIRDGMVMQRDTTASRIFFEAEAKGDIQASVGTVRHIGKNVYVYSGVPVGGPYVLTLNDDEGDVTFHDVYVGDVFMLGGQSNMEGAGCQTPEMDVLANHHNENVRAYYMNEAWDKVRPQLHQMWDSIDPFIHQFWCDHDEMHGMMKPTTPSKCGVGPGFAFAMQMHEFTKLPVGVIPCALGGSTMEFWSPDVPDRLYHNAMRRIKECGNHIAGIFWYQGESETNPDRAPLFAERMQYMVKSFRKRLCDENIAFVQVQLDRMDDFHPLSGVYWMIIRNLQDSLNDKIPKFATVYSMDCDTDDRVHLSSEAQMKIGKRGAEAMANLLYGVGKPSPKLERVSVEKDPYHKNANCIRLHYTNLHGHLTSKGVPAGFFINDDDQKEHNRMLVKTMLEGDDAVLRVEIKDVNELTEKYIGYGFLGAPYCNVTDEADRSIAAFGPVKLKELMK